MVIVWGEKPASVRLTVFFASEAAARLCTPVGTAEGIDLDPDARDGDTRLDKTIAAAENRLKRQWKREVRITVLLDKPYYLGVNKKVGDMGR